MRTLPLFQTLLICIGIVIPSCSAAPVFNATEVYKNRKVRQLNFDKIKALPESLPPGKLGKIFRKFQPYLYIKNGCSSYPAVDAQGRVNKGLGADDLGKDEDVCRSSKGQLYVRARQMKSTYAIMYSWYMPRDFTWTADLSEKTGHRHEWERAIVWLSKSSLDAKIIGVSLSAHGKFPSFARKDFHFKDTHPLVAYGQAFDRFRNNQMLKADEDEIGDLQPMVAWEQLSKDVRDSLEDPKSFEGKGVGVTNAQFKDNTQKAWMQFTEETQTRI